MADLFRGRMSIWRIRSFQDILAIIDAATGEDPLVATFAVALGVIIILPIAWKYLPSRWHKACCIAVASACVVLFASIKFGLLRLTGVASALLVLCLFAVPVNYYWCKQRLDTIADKANPALPGCDFVAAFKLMKAAKPSLLSRQQLACLNEDRIFCNVNLGNNGVAKKMLNDESLEPAFRHFALHIIADAACDHDGSKAELESALAAESDETDPFIKIQLRHNRAIAHIENGQFKVADDEFKKIYRDAKRWDIRNKSFLLMLFENAVLNKTRVDLPDGGVEEGRRLIGECERALAPFGPYDYGQLFNLRILFMRQIGASAAEKNELYLAEVANTVDDESLSGQQRVVAMVSLGRMAWADGLDPSPILDFFGDGDCLLGDLGPDARYSIYLNLRAMLADLSMGDRFPTALAENVGRYFLDGGC